MSPYPNLLTSTELENIFRNNILPRYSPQLSTCTQPVCYILGGQPGSGKTTMIQGLVEDARDIPLIINGDDLRSFHPMMRDFLESDDKNASDLVQADCNYWVGALIRLCLENQTSFVVEGTMRSSVAAIKTAREAKNHGFEVEAHVMSIPPMVSQASIFARYEYQKTTTGAGRYVKPSSHQEATQGLPNSLRDISRQASLFDTISIHTHDGVCDHLLTTLRHGENGHWDRDVESFFAVFETRFGMTLVGSEREYVLKLWEIAVESARLRGENEEYIEELIAYKKTVENDRGRTFESRELSRVA